MRQFVFVVATSMVVGFFAGLASAESPAVPATQQVSPGPSPRYCYYYYGWRPRAYNYYYYQQPLAAAPAARVQSAHSVPLRGFCIVFALEEWVSYGDRQGTVSQEITVDGVPDTAELG